MRIIHLRPTTAVAAIALCVATTALAQEPVEAPVVQPTGPAPAAGHFHRNKPPGPIRRAARRTMDTVHRHFIGDPQEFVEPPLGYYLYETIGTMKAKADPHQFTLYRSDFLVGTTRLSPAGARRFNDMARKMPKWLGPMVVEWTPDDPQLADARKNAVVALMSHVGAPVGAERVVVGPSPYYGAFGTEAGNMYNIEVYRYGMAPFNFSVTPSTTATFSGGGQR